MPRTTPNASETKAHNFDSTLTSNFVILPSKDDKKRSEIMHAYWNMLNNKGSDIKESKDGLITILSNF